MNNIGPRAEDAYLSESGQVIYDRLSGARLIVRTPRVRCKTHETDVILHNAFKIIVLIVRVPNSFLYRTIGVSDRTIG